MLLLQVEGSNGEIHDVDTSHIYRGDLVGKYHIYTYLF